MVQSQRNRSPETKRCEGRPREARRWDVGVQACRDAVGLRQVPGRARDNAECGCLKGLDGKVLGTLKLGRDLTDLLGSHRKPSRSESSHIKARQVKQVRSKIADRQGVGRKELAPLSLGRIAWSSSAEEEVARWEAEWPADDC